MDFSKMTAEQLGREIERFRAQLYAQKTPITDAQKRRFDALRRAYRKASAAEYI